ncbi:hypothetical protein LO762_28500 [Actinocorallia sp. API 0066]|uniref:hypothetical protein n=1 Tax=Actinocorallia sp. API 0066 TaxID=2896846 RepID=UPI001E4A2DE4|nr:hypothetical protein [Actinocorallia sp. API 0066]MCD0453094.1 hypothetical protein [Actinocorallia sp. API 0066]
MTEQMLVEFISIFLAGIIGAPIGIAQLAAAVKVVCILNEKTYTFYGIYRTLSFIVILIFISVTVYTLVNPEAYRELTDSAAQDPYGVSPAGQIGCALGLIVSHIMVGRIRQVLLDRRR